MEKQQKEKLERYLKNSFQFMWGLGQGDKHKTYAWLRQANIKIPSDKYTYNQVEGILLGTSGLGLENVIVQIVVPRVRKLFNKEQLDFLRNCWQLGRRPYDVELQRHFHLDRSLFYMYQEIYPFIELKLVNKKYYMERWGEFAGIWFEEIEPFIGE